MATRLTTITQALISNVHLGISEKESYFEVHFLNARNEVNKIEGMANIELQRIKEESPHGRSYTRYLVANAEQVRKIANLHNNLVTAGKAGKNKKQYEDVNFISEQQIQQAIELLGKK
ncbi:hypothetical protein A1D22_02575 [Pasteurellaceae bacterium LFhippo2]|nr:hypothetical protein [Pasteurellaceae bacterium LFhippo2]